MNRYTWITRATVGLAIFDMRRRAIDLLSRHVKQLEEPLARSSTILYIGMLHLELGEEKEASQCFLEGLTIVESMELAYAPEFLTMLRVMKWHEDSDVIEHWIQNFTHRIEDHPKFKRTIKGIKAITD
ncbi:hypothetical protein [Exiguobacterium acetylicum]|uniref:hypothetical protein n=1 Tax=Exiguobacterium acetylicum TaxID=41170 RepID=UPI001EE36C64|nr:hypothetical protein [Exiguobacterium acetylicum]UKS57382.1 hypothetical protein K6T22_07160 [Exiguobacterium acetylicum]